MADKEEVVLLTEQEVYDVIAFARAFNGLSYLTPDLINKRMQELTLTPEYASETELQKYMKDPRNNEKHLRGFGQGLEIISMPYKRLIHYLANMPSWDLTYTADNIEKSSEYNSPKYKKDLAILENFMTRLDYKKEFPIAVKEMMRNDAFFFCPRDGGSKIILQELPVDFCKITGRWENGFLFSFNMYYFLQPGVDVYMYPAFFRKKYNEIWGNENNTMTDYRPHISPLERGRSSWVYWVDVPVDVGWVFKMSPEITTELPYFNPLFSDLVLQPIMRNLQKNINMSAASRIITGEVPMLKDAKASVKDAISITPDVLGKFLALVKSAVSESVRIAAAPLENLKGISFPAENDMYSEFMRTALASSGVNTNLIFSDTIKPNVLETQLSLNVDEQIITSIYPQFSQFVSYFINASTKYYKFSLKFEGTNFFTNRNLRKEEALALLDKGIVLPQKIASAHGMTPWEMRKMMEEAEASNFIDKLTPPAMALQEKFAPEEPEVQADGQTKPLGGKKTGRPRKKDEDLSESGNNTRAGGDNIQKGGKV